MKCTWKVLFVNDEIDINLRTLIEINILSDTFIAQNHTIVNLSVVFYRYFIS